MNVEIINLEPPEVYYLFIYHLLIQQKGDEGRYNHAIGVTLGG